MRKDEYLPDVQGWSKKNTRVGNRVNHDLKLSKWYKNTSIDALDNGESENVSFGLTSRVTVGHCNVFEGTSFLTSPSHTFFETY